MYAILTDPFSPLQPLRTPVHIISSVRPMARQAPPPEQHTAEQTPPPKQQTAVVSLSLEKEEYHLSDRSK